MCGIVGLIGTQDSKIDASREAFLGLTTLQHRGQDAAGILSYDEDGFHRVKNVGLVESIFTRENMEGLTGNMAVGHARYSTIGRGDIADVQPFLISYPYGIGMVHNGNIVNVAELAQDLKVRARRHLLTHSDTEVVLNLFAEGLAQSSSAETLTSDTAFETICASVSEIFKKVNGSYSIVALIADQGLVAFRDPYGIRPLVWGKRGNAHCLVSESVALGILDYEKVRDLAPGEVIFIDQAGKVHTRVLDARPARHCMFEWVYFASPESEIDQVPVYGTRIQLGRSLGKVLKKQIEDRKIEADIIVPVPETSRIAAIALAEELGIPYREVLIKNRYIKRTFILDSQEKRQKAVNLKLSPVRSEIEGKRVILVDDSIVRGTTSKKIIELVRKAGASKVFFVSTCPPIQHPCFYGIDFPDESELIASNRTNAEVCDALGADAVIYQDVEGLKVAISEAQGVAHPQPDGLKPKSNLCTACLDGCYPTNVVSPGNQMAAGRKADRLRHVAGRGAPG